MSTRPGPFTELQRLFDRMSKQFEETSHRWDRQEPFGVFSATGESMAIDLLEEPERFVLRCDIPGFDRDEVSIGLTDRTLVIDAKHEREAEGRDESYHRRERPHRNLHRTVELPAEVDEDAVSASIDQGVLTIELPKTTIETSHEIEIQ